MVVLDNVNILFSDLRLVLLTSNLATRPIPSVPDIIQSSASSRHQSEGRSERTDNSTTTFRLNIREQRDNQKSLFGAIEEVREPIAIVMPVIEGAEV